MKSHRKKRSRSAEAASGSKPSPSHDSEEKPAASPTAPHPPKRNVTMLSVSVVLFAIWISFLLYAVLFG
jgi:hypothetical protein